MLMDDREFLTASVEIRDDIPARGHDILVVEYAIRAIGITDIEKCERERVSRVITECRRVG